MRHDLPPSLPDVGAEDTSIRAGEMSPVVMRFSERLRRMPLGAWADAAEGVAEAYAAEVRIPDDVTPDAAARARLRAIVDRMPHMATQVRRRVQGLAAAAEAFVHPATLARMRKTALTAALALAARPHLSDEEFERLYAPFESIIPLAELEGEEQMTGLRSSRESGAPRPAV